jgi:hypothetical protein
MNDLRRRLTNAGVSRWMLNRGEQKMLTNYLRSDETIEACTRVVYKGSRAVVVATSRRLLLLDKHLASFYTRVIQYDSITDIRYFRRFIDASIFVTINGKNIMLKSMSDSQLRRLSTYLRGKVLISQAENNAQDDKSPLQIFKTPEFDMAKKFISPRHRHGKFLISLR